MAKSREKKIFVLDTSVILYSHDSILNFQEHDVGIPITVLEELDQFKKGNDSKNFEAREFTRLLDKLAKDQMLKDWIPLNGKTRGKFKVLMDFESTVDARKVFGDDKNDHRILNTALANGNFAGRVAGNRQLDEANPIGRGFFLFAAFDNSGGIVNVYLSGHELLESPAGT